MRPSTVSGPSYWQDNCQIILSTARDNSSGSEKNYFYMPGFSQILLSARQYCLFFRNSKVKLNSKCKFAFLLPRQLEASTCSFKKSTHIFFTGSIWYWFAASSKDWTLLLLTEILQNRRCKIRITKITYFVVVKKKKKKATYTNSHK